MTESIKRFSEFNLHPDLLKSIEGMGYNTCTPIQERCLPVLLTGADLTGLAQTGTGKTAAFLIPLIDRVLRSMNPEPTPDPALEGRFFKDWQYNHFILILVPTRELVTQVYENLTKLTEHTPLTSVFLYGGVGYDEQKAALKKPFQFVVSTPGRLIDLYKEGFLDFKQARAVVFDEADRMFDMGFQQDVFYILRRAPQDRQLLMFSATLNLHVTEMAYQANSHPVEVDVSRDKITTTNIDDVISHIGNSEKPKYLLSILKKYDPKQVIIFSNFKNKVPRISQFLNENGYPSLGISSLMTQSQRNRVIERFKTENSHNIMVATDLAARGLDIKGVDLVINFELPEDAENYVHRIGRTGRAEQKGRAISFVSDKDVEALGRIESYLKEKLEVFWLDDTDFVTDFKAFPPDEFRRSYGDRPQRGGDRMSRNSSPRRDGGGDRGPRGEGGPRSGGGNVHRDRKTGRHRGPKSGEGSQRGDRPQRQDRDNNRDNNRNENRNERSNQGRQPYKKRNDNRPRRNEGRSHDRKSSSSSTPKNTGSLWGRITASVKKLIKK